MNCMLVSRTADSWLNLENECTSCRFEMEVQDNAKLDPKWQDEAFIGIRDRSDEMLIMTTSGVYKTRKCSENAQSWSVGISSSSRR